MVHWILCCVKYSLYALLLTFNLIYIPHMWHIENGASNNGIIFGITFTPHHFRGRTCVCADLLVFHLELFCELFCHFLQIGEEIHTREPTYAHRYSGMPCYNRLQHFFIGAINIAVLSLSKSKSMGPQLCRCQMHAYFAEGERLEFSIFLPFEYKTSYAWSMRGIHSIYFLSHMEFHTHCFSSNKMIILKPITQALTH